MAILALVARTAGVAVGGAARLPAAAARRWLPHGRHAATTPAMAVEAPAGGTKKLKVPAGAAATTEEPAPPPVHLPTNEESDDLLKIRHTTAHVMAMAVQKLWKDAKVTIGPWIEKGFYYDFDMPPLADKDLRRVKKEMDKIIQQKLPLLREEVSADEAERRIREAEEPYKLEILESIKARDPEAPITLYHMGGLPGTPQHRWWDLCAGPHVEHTGLLPKDAIALESIAGAYWRGDESRPMLQRIYGTAWETAEQLAEHQRLVEEAKRRDHRTIGKALDLFSIQEEAGGGLVFWHPKGATVRRLMEDYWRQEHLAAGYDFLYTPHMASLGLWKTSGHFDFYADGMFDQMEVEGAEYQLKPMNCPFHVLTYKDTPKSYRDLPLRWAELGTVYRYERSGTLAGLFRVRGFTQDDAHIFCLPDQLTDEIVGVLDLFEAVLSKFGFTEYEVMLSTKPEKAVGSEDIWEKSTAALEGALVRKGWKYDVDDGGGAFYGPKIDLKIKDAIGRLWQCSTVQCDFNLPMRFDMEYIGEGGAKERPIMVHRAIFGSVERFFGVLIESTAGDFPFWLAPTQLRLLPVSDDFLPYCREVVAKAKAAGIRAEVDRGGRSLGKQIKLCAKEKVAVYGVVGKEEVEGSLLSLTSRKGGDLGQMTLDSALGAMVAAVTDDSEPHEMMG